jgi:hypothetical protein
VHIRQREVVAATGTLSPGPQCHLTCLVAACSAAYLLCDDYTHKRCAEEAADLRGQRHTALLDNSERSPSANFRCGRCGLYPSIGSLPPLVS